MHLGGARAFACQGGHCLTATGLVKTDPGKLWVFWGEEQGLTDSEDSDTGSQHEGAHQCYVIGDE